MPRITLLVGLALVAVLRPELGWSAETSAAGSLELIGAAGGQEYRDFVVERGEIFIRAGGENRSLPRGIRWRMDGDLRAQGDGILFAPGHRITTRETLPLTADAHTRTHAALLVRRGGPWSDRQLAGGILVFCWLVDGRPVWVWPAAASTREGPSGTYAAVAALELGVNILRGAPVVLLLQQNQWVAPRPTFGDAATRRACAEMYLGSREDFERSLGLKNFVGREGRGGVTLLHIAAEGGFIDALNALLAHGAKPNVRNEDGVTPLHAAAAAGRVAPIRALLARGAGRFVQDGLGSIPLEVAIGRGHLDAACDLLGEKASNEKVRSVRMLAAIQGETALVERLVTLEAEGHDRRLPASVAVNPVFLVDPAGEAYAAADVDLPPVLKNAVTPQISLRLRQDIQSLVTTELISVPQLRGAATVVERSTIEPLGPFSMESANNHWAVASLVVGLDGRPRSIQIVDAMSVEFARAVRQVLSKYEFLPGERNGQPVPTRIVLPVTVEP